MLKTLNLKSLYWLAGPHAASRSSSRSRSYLATSSIKISSKFSNKPSNISVEALPRSAVMNRSGAVPLQHQMRMQIQKRAFIKFFRDPFAVERLNRAKPLMNLVVLACVLSVIGVTTYAYGSHWYIENLVQPTSDKLDPETRRLLRAYAFRKILYPDPRIAVIYIERAIKNLDNLGMLDYSKPQVLDVLLKFADAQLSNGEHESAKATLDDIISSLNLILEAQTQSSLTPPENTAATATEAGTAAGLTVGGQENDISKEWVLYNLCSSDFMLGQLFTSLNDIKSAKQAYTDALNKLPALQAEIENNQKAHLNTTQVLAKQSAVNLLRVNITLCLGEIFTLEANYKTAETLFNGALSQVNAHNSDSNSKADSSRVSVSAADTELEKGESTLLTEMMYNDPFPVYDVYSVHNLDDSRQQLSANKNEDSMLQRFIDKIDGWAVKTARSYKERSLATSKSSDKEKHHQALDGWACLDAVIMNQMAQMYKRQLDYDNFKKLAQKVTNSAYPKDYIPACVECAFYSLFMLAQFYEDQKDIELASDFYSKSLALATKHSLPALKESEAKANEMWNLLSKKSDESSENTI